MFTSEDLCKNLASILKSARGKNYEKKAIRIINTRSSGSLHLREMNLTIEVLHEILLELNRADQQSVNPFSSISFSYNSLFGNSGAQLVEKLLPRTLKELGLVNCQISDEGGEFLLEWMKNSPNLRMACIENNNFSHEMKMRFKNWATKNNQLMLIV